MYLSTVCLATLIATINALTFTSPTEGQILDPSGSLTVTWTSTSSDPSTFDLAFEQPGGLLGSEVIGSSISTSSGSYVIPANTLITYGSEFVFNAQNQAGDVLATSPSFVLSVGAATTGNPANVPDATATAQTALGITSTNTNGPASTLATGTATGSEVSTTHSGSMTGFSTSTTSATSTNSHSSSTRASSSSSSSATTSANAQPRLASNSQIAFSAAGLLAGLAALLA